MNKYKQGFINAIDSLHPSPEGGVELEEHLLERNVSVKKSIRSKLLLLGVKQEYLPEIIKVDHEELIENLELFFKLPLENQAYFKAVSKRFFQIIEDEFSPEEYFCSHNEIEEQLIIVLQSKKIRVLLRLVSYDD